MAEDIVCSSVTFEDDGITRSYTSCWTYSIPDPGWNPEVIGGGLPRSLSTTARSWRTCKYFVKGMSPVCKNFDGTSQKCTVSTSDGLPSGYNGSNCDYLGRQSSCSKYDPSTEEDLEEFICVLPNMFLSGVGRRDTTQESLALRSIKINEIDGYNDDGNGVGQCDCYGMGRGENGCGFADRSIPFGSVEIERKLSELPVVCNFYRPWAMGFGAIEPHSAYKEDGSLDVDKMIELSEKDEPYTYRLPFSFEVFNLRARFQKCLWYEKSASSIFSTWDYLNGTFVVLDGDEAFDSNDQLLKCKCPDSQSDPYRTRLTGQEAPTNIMANVWAKAGTVICNGAKPECPCYTGKWLYCIDEKMWDGMPVTAQQIMELRFWSYDWSSQKEYDDYYMERPNSDDSPRPEIYTFTKFSAISTIDEFTQMVGKKVALCQPTPLHMKDFDPEIFLKSTPVTYANFGTNFTGQATFSTLIRDPRFPNLKPLTVIYPYAFEEIFSSAACTDNSNLSRYRKKTCETYEDMVYVVGCTVPGASVYVVNMTRTEGKVPSIITDNANFLQLSDEKRAAYSQALSTYLLDIEEKNCDCITKDLAEDKFGVFILGPIKLAFGDNDLLICADFGAGEYNFTKRNMTSLWCGGVATQEVYEYNGAEATNPDIKQPDKIDPAAEISAKILPLGGSASFDCFPVRSVMIPSVFAGDKYYYSYSMYWEEVEGEVITKACSVGNSTYIWAEINNIDINYIYDLEILEAMATVVLHKDTTKEETINVQLQQIELDYRYIPPNACLFKPIDTNIRFRFLPHNCTLTLKYKYQKFVNSAVPSDKVGIWGGGMGPNYIFSDPRYEIKINPDSLAIENISSESVSIMFFFKDEYERIVSVVATKFMPYIVRPACRNVEIRYRYKADGAQLTLVPESGFCINVQGTRPTGRIVSHISDPICGDHLMAPSGRGPLWFPYSRCETIDFYDVFTFANYCVAPYDMKPRLDYRYRGPEQYQASAEVRGNWLAACDCGWKFYYSRIDSSNTQFTGYANRKGIIDETEYEANGWRLPPFGNEGRNLIERYLSQDYIYYYDFQNPMIVHSEWVPFTMDNDMFYLGFDAFKSLDITYDLDFSNSFGFSDLDNFKHVAQPNFLLCSPINETVEGALTYDRFRFEDIFESHIEGNCVYPSPVIPSTYTSSVSFYLFKDESYTWAWQELWKEVERNGTSAQRLDFISEYERPPYVWSLFKEEVRLICEEGPHEVLYKGPEIDEQTGEISTYPSVSLDGQYPKYFEIIYGSPVNGVWSYDSTVYADESVEWKTEGAKGKVQGSSEKDNPYEDRMNSEWVFGHDDRFKNMLFDDSVEGEFYYRMDEITGEYIKLKYCTGMMVRIPKNRLIYLPKDKTKTSIPFEQSTNPTGGFNFDTSAFEVDEDVGGFTCPGSTMLSSSLEEVGAISQIEITGKYGLFYDEIDKRRYEYVTPGVSIVGTTIDGDTNYVPRGFVTSSYKLLEKKKGVKTQLVDYALTFNFTLSPIEMLKKKFTSISISLSAPSWGNINVTSLSIETATYKSEVSETITVWERKYMVSKGNVQWPSPDGPEDILHYKKGGGVHFRFSTFPDQEIKTQDKLRGIFCDTPYFGLLEDESISVDCANLQDVEREEQKILYDKAMKLDKTLPIIDYKIIAPPPHSLFFTKIGTVSYTGLGSSVFLMTGLEWGNHPLVKSFKQYSFWYPGGHYYIWSDTTTYQSCHVATPALVGIDYQHVYSGVFKHVGHTDAGQSEEFSVDPGNSYYSLRFEYEVARYERWEKLYGTSPDAGGDLLVRANPYNSGL